jgi:hypothetical protein
VGALPGTARCLGAAYAGVKGDGGPTVAACSTAETPRPSVHRTRVWSPRGRDAADARAGAAALRRRPFLFRGPALEITKLQKLSTNLKISKNKSCRGAIDLQLSQRASYVLINRLSGNVGRSCRLSMARVTVHSAVNLIFGQFALKIGMSANYENCVPGNNEQLSYWPILNFYSEIWRTRKKTESAFLRSRVLTTIWDFDQGLLCKCVPNHVKHV